jgi:hypothetical protein
MNKFLDTYDHQKLNEQDINHLTWSIASNVIEAAIKCLPNKKSPGPERFTAKF